MPRTFKHSGDMGDIIFALPTVRALGGGILYLDPQGGEREPLTHNPHAGATRTKLTRDRIDFLRPLLLQQPYIHDVCYWSGEPVECNLDQFRRIINGTTNACEAHLRAFGLPPELKDVAWLEVDHPLPVQGHPLVISRTVRHQSNHNFWERTLHRFHKQCLFVGLLKELQIFEYSFGRPVRYFPTPTALEMARVIAGCEKFIGNQSLAHAIAEGLKQNLILEYSRVMPTALFARPGVVYV